MTNQEILEKAITQAAGNGWDRFGWEFFKPDELKKGLRAGASDIGAWANDDSGQEPIWFPAEEIIYDHDFAKAFWGKGTNEHYWEDGGQEHLAFGGKLMYPYDEGAGISLVVEDWKWHIQQQVISDDPIKYLKNGLK